MYLKNINPQLKWVKILKIKINISAESKKGQSVADQL